MILTQSEYAQNLITNWQHGTTKPGEDIPPDKGVQVTFSAFSGSTCDRCGSDLSGPCLVTNDALLCSRCCHEA